VHKTSLYLAAIAVASTLACATLIASPATATSSTRPSISRVSAETKAALLAQSSGRPVTVSSATTETTRVTAQPDGSMQLESSTVPVRIKRAGEWIPVDLTLARSASGTLAPKASAIPMSFSGGGSSRLARIATRTGSWLTESWPLGTLPRPTLSGARATYSHVLPGVDLVLTATAFGMSEVIVVESAAAAKNPKLASVSLLVSGMSVSAGSSGISLATASDGSTLSSSEPVWWDSSLADASPDGAGELGFPQPLPHRVLRNDVTIDTHAVLDAPGLTYPLFIDPDWNSASNTGWYIDQFKPGFSYVNGSTMKVGYASAADSSDHIQHYTKSFWNIDTSGLKGRHVTASHFDTWETFAGNYYCATRDVSLSRVDQPGGYTWSSGNPGSSTLQDTVNTAHGRGCAEATVPFTTLEAARYSASNNRDSLTLMATAAYGDDVAWKQFAVAATLYATYNSVPNVPTGQAFISPSLVCSPSASTPAYANNAAQALSMQVTASDPDIGSNLSTTFAVVDGESLATVASFQSPLEAQGEVTAQIPQGTLGDGLYAWHASSSDGLDASGFSGYCFVRIQNAGPALPVLTATTSTDALVGRPIAVAIAGSATSVLFGYWWVDGGKVSPSPTPPAAVLPIDLSTGTPNCTAAHSAGEGFACANSAGNATVTVAAIDAPRATLWVAAYDAAGNVSTSQADSSHAAGLSIKAAGDIARVDLGATKGGDFWQAGTVTKNGVIPTANPKHGTGSLSIANSTQVVRAPKSSQIADAQVLAFRGQVAFGQGWLLPIPVGAKRSDVPAGMSALYSCQSSGTQLHSLDGNCEGTGTTGSAIGYLWKANGSTADKTRPVYRCGLTSQEERVPSNCPIDQPATLLGYVNALQDTASGVDTTVIDDTRAHTFSYSAWVDENSTAADFSDVHENHVLFDYPGLFRLSVTPENRWQLCWADSIARCAIAQAVAPGEWDYVTVVSDPINQQLRLVLNGRVAAAFVVDGAVSTSAGASTHQFTVGAAADGSGQSWIGYIDDVTAFPGVVDTTQLARLMHERAPQ
jgi:hypothetical protein